MDQKKIWDYFQTDSNALLSFKARKRFNILAGRILIGESVLNIGIGNGRLERILSARGVNVYSLDPSETAVHLLSKALGLGDKARVGYADCIPFQDGHFDVVVMSEVLEHIDDKSLLISLAEVCRVLRVGGRLLGTVPADEIYEDNIVVCPSCGMQFHRWGHQRSFSREGLIRLLSNHFININISRRVMCDMFQLNWKGKLYCLIKYITLFCNIKGSHETLLFEAHKK